MRRFFLWIFFVLIIIGASCASLNKFQKSGQSIANKKQEAFNSTAAQHFIRGSINELRGDYKSAHLEYSQALLYDSSSATIYNKITEQYIRMKNIESAKKMLLITEKRFPTNISTHKILASIFFSEQQWKKAEQELQKIIELDPGDIDSRYNLITAYLHQGQDLKVADQYEKMMQIGYGSPEMQIKIGEIYLKNSLFDKTEKVFKEFLIQHLDDERSYLAMAKLSITKKDTASAIDWYQKGIQKNTNFDTCLEELRDIYIEQKKWDRAISLLKQTIAKDTSKIENHLRLGELYFRKGDTTAAIDQFDQTINLFPEDFRAHFSAGSINYQLGNWESAKKFLQKSVKLKQNFERGWTLLGFIYIRNKKLENAEQHFKKAVEIFPESRDINYFLGSVLQQQKKYDEALPYLEKALELEPDNINTLNTLAMIYDEKKMYDKSDVMYEKALKLIPGDPLLMNNYSYSLSERGIKLEEAKTMSEKAVAADSTNGAYLDTLGWIYFKLGELQKALQYISKATKVRDQSAEVWEHLGDVYEKLSDIENAKINWQKAIELDENRTWLLDKLKDK